MQRVVVLGPGGAGKSTLSHRLGQRLGLPVVELDQLFWKAGLEPTPGEEWALIQRGLVEPERWILDGDLGPYDVLEVRLSAADTIIVLDSPCWRCVWRTVRRGRERLDYWRWLLTWRRTARPIVMDAVARYAPGARVHVLRSPRDVARLMAEWVPAESTDQAAFATRSR